MRQRQAPWLPTSPSRACTRPAPALASPAPRGANQSKGGGKAPLNTGVMGSYTFPWTGHPFPARTTSVAPLVPCVPQGCGVCSPVGVSRASFAFYSCLALLLAGGSVGNNEVGERETQSKCTSRNEAARRFLCMPVHGVLSYTGTAATVPSTQQQQRRFKVHTRDSQLKPEQFPLLAPTSVVRNCRQHDASPRRSKVAAHLRQKYLF